jgi:hypothetical protein
MGYIAHNAIVVTSCGKADIYAAAKKARDLGLTIVGPPVKEAVNGYRSFLICPDGSKEGWDTSNEGDERRSEWKAWLRASNHDAEWCEVRYGYDDGAATVADHGFGASDDR